MFWWNDEIIYDVTIKYSWCTSHSYDTTIGDSKSWIRIFRWWFCRLANIARVLDCKLPFAGWLNQFGIQSHHGTICWKRPKDHFKLMLLLLGPNDSWPMTQVGPPQPTSHLCRYKHCRGPPIKTCVVTMTLMKWLYDPPNHLSKNITKYCVTVCIKLQTATSTRCDCSV